MIDVGYAGQGRQVSRKKTVLEDDLGAIPHTRKKEIINIIQTKIGGFPRAKRINKKFVINSKELCLLLK